jgi:hypothetical protein
MIEVAGKLVPNPPVKVGEHCCDNAELDPLFKETAVTKPVDFHSFRRAFSTALADAGVNAQLAMRLASHSDERTHMRYVMTTPAMKAIPDAAVPRLPLGLLHQQPKKTQRVLNVEAIRPARRISPAILARPDRFERPTTGFEVPTR